MTRGSRPGKPGSGALTDDDHALWSHVAEQAEPLRAKPRVPSHETGDTPRPASPLPRPSSHATLPSHPKPPPRPAHPRPTPPHPAPVPAPAKAPPLADFDRRKAKKIASGREPIDARIDLHGMRQSEAHIALRGFLLSCYAQGCRNVLVITGKGGPAADPDEPRPFLMDTRERGVLRRNVPVWLAEPELRAIVVSYRNAAPSHGGAGALYVHLRARRKSGARD